MNEPTDPADPVEPDDDLDDDEQAALPTELLGAGNPLEAIFGGGGMPDLGSLVEGLGAVQGIQSRSFEGSAGGGLVRIEANGRMEVASVRIDPAALDEPDAELLGDLVLAALNDLTGQIAAAQQEAMGPLGGILGQ